MHKKKVKWLNMYKIYSRLPFEVIIHFLKFEIVDKLISFDFFFVWTVTG